MHHSSLRTPAQSGFSLVELAIVLVILGLLTGGVLSGQSLIRSAELRSVTNDYSKYSAAVRSFRDKYFALPGDMSNAQRFWGAATCSTTAATTFTALTCNGDGNGLITTLAPSGTTGQEPYRFWQHLANSGIIEGSYLGTSAASVTGAASPGIVLADLVSSVADATLNVPRSRLQGAGWSAIYVGVKSSDTYYYDGSYDNVFQLGVPVSSGAYGTTGPMLRAEDAWNLDTKLDDSIPGTGTVTSLKTQTGCATVSTAYNLSSTSGSAACSLIFKMGV